MTTPDLVTLYQKDGGLQAQPWGDAKPVHFVRRDPAVLAALPEVRAMADDLASCIAMIQHAIGAGKDVFIEPDTRKKLSDARSRLDAFRAAAIREGHDQWLKGEK